MPEVSIVIPNYNGERFLKACLTSLFDKTTIDMDVIVVDNGSQDKSLLIMETYEHVQVVKLRKNYGFCTAVNIGIMKANTPYVLLLNNDVVIETGFVEALLESIKKDVRTFSVEALMIQYHHTGLVDSAGTYYNAMGWAFAKGKDKALAAYEKPRSSFAACGGAAIYRKEVFETIGYFDELHFAYLEDVDLGYRARLYGYKNRYEPNARVYHLGSGASGSRHNAFKAKYSGRNNIFLIYKNMPLWQILLNVPLLLMGFLIKILFYCRKNLGGAYIKGILEGIALCKPQRKLVNRIKPSVLILINIQLKLWIYVFYRF